MKLSSIPTSFALLLALGAITLLARSNEPKPKADDSRVNQRDQKQGEATAGQQKRTAGDRDLAAKIRRSLMADKSLSLYAHNVKIISQNGIVTLKGPVRTDLELQTILANTVEITGNLNKIVNEMAVAPTTSK